MQTLESMITTQLIARGVKDPRVIEAFRHVDRKHFVPKENVSSAYGDYPLAIGHDQTISQPFIVGLMTEALKLKPTDTVLELGTGSGFQTAILAYLSHHVYTAERIAMLSDNAQDVLSKLNIDNVTFHTGDGLKAFKDKHFDKIIVTAAAETLPHALTELLKEGGIMVIPVGKVIHDLLRIENIGGTLKKTVLCQCRFVPLICDE